MKTNAKLVIGGILILFGIIFLIDTMGILSFLNLTTGDIIGILWPTILLVLGIKMLFDKNISLGIILTSFGTIFLLTHVFNISFFAMLWPMIIIVLGLTMIFRRDNPHMTEGKKYYGGDRISETVVFWGIDRNMDSKDFKGGDVTVAFGGAKLDLRNAQIDKNGATLVLNTAFGGIEVLLPKDCNVVSDGVGILGGWENKFSSKDTKGGKLEITGTAIFGGVEIKE